MNKQTKDGETALIFAAEKNNLEVMKLLVRKGADMDVQNPEGKTALILATEHQCPGIEFINFKF